MQIERIAAADLSDLLEQTKTLGEAIDQNLNQGFKDMFSSIIDGSKSAGEALLDFISNAASMLLSSGLDGLFGSTGGSGALGGLFSGLFGADGHIPGSSTQASIANYATGNVGGLLAAAARESSAMPAGASLVVANSSEAILTTGMQNNLANSLGSGGVSSTVNIVVNNTGPNLEPAALRIIDQRVQKTLSDEMRAGGSLRR